MAKEKTASLKPRSILDLAPGKLREIDGVVLDLDSYAKHCPAPAEAPAPAAASSCADGGAPLACIQLSEPVHTGWYEAAEETVAYPIMERYAYAGGSGSGSYLTSFRTSYLRSSSSWTSSGSGVFSVGGYGLELI